MLNNLTITAGQTLEYFEPGDFFRLMDGPNPVSLIFYRNGAEINRAEKVGEGYAESFGAGGFDRYRITSETTQSIQFVSRLGNAVQYDKAPTGDTNVVNTVTVKTENTAFTQSGKTVTNASTSLLAGKADRRYLLVQNNDSSGIVYITLDGTAATTGKGLRLLPGDAFEVQWPAPTGQIFAIGSVASNANVIAVEG